MAMVVEIDALVENGTWQVVDRSPETKPLHSKWVYKKKQDANGNLVRYKARLVACGNEQTYGKDYFDTFAPVMALLTAEAEYVAMVEGIK